MNNKKPLSVGIWGNTDKEKFWELLNPIIKWADQNRLETFITTRIREKLKTKLSDKIKII